MLPYLNPRFNDKSSNEVVTIRGPLQSRKIEIRCFCIDPSVKSSLRFLRTTPWAREKVESLYLYVLRQKAKQKS